VCRIPTSPSRQRDDARAGEADPPEDRGHVLEVARQPVEAFRQTTSPAATRSSSALSPGRARTEPLIAASSKTPATSHPSRAARSRQMRTWSSIEAPLCSAVE
jgi:hypothetical protein